MAIIMHMNKLIIKSACKICQVIDHTIEVTNNNPNTQYRYRHLDDAQAFK